MAFETFPLTPERFDDFADVVNPNRRSTHCWCVVHRLRAGDVRAVGGGDRERAMRALCERPVAPGVVGYVDGEPVGWCHVGPRADIPKLVASSRILPVDDLPVWSVICTVIRGGYRRRGYTTDLLAGAVAHAFGHGAPAVEAYPVDAEGGRIDVTMAFVGTRAMFEKVGFVVVGQTDAVASGRPRLVMRRFPG
ncbi:GNAT family N-acetyltransferase [Austwickia chelonae]|uniref:Putative acetyltransferase n=1 Tax=Austwickia chelonae NBRC 105200 TaxID=1184607 RepID=K6VMC0_9MICO|nr:GNAT family N-acetyltransferase [Austwickia chelonae]GAB77894.1 putative acetyltransferase [Austwickia chelonae NBRC 105200]